MLALTLALTSGCGDDAGPAGGGRPPTPVVVSSPFEHEFADRLEALGTARANESVVLTARVTETVRRLFFEDGQWVDAGAILAELESGEERAQLAEAQANLADARMRFERVADLAERGTESQSRYDEVRTALEAAEARVAEVEARLSDRRIRAPFAGKLGLREVSPGTLLQPGDRITTLDDIDRIKLEFSVPETFFAMLEPGLAVETQSASYPDRVFLGRIAAVDSRIDPETRSVRVRAEIDNPDHGQVEIGYRKLELLLDGIDVADARKSLGQEEFEQSLSLLGEAVPRVAPAVAERHLAHLLPHHGEVLDGRPSVREQRGQRSMDRLAEREVRRRLPGPQPLHVVQLILPGAGEVLVDSGV